MWNRAGFFDEAGGMMYGGKGKRKGKNSKNMIKYFYYGDNIRQKSGAIAF